MADEIEVRNPYDDSLLGTVPLCGADEVDRACRTAAAALARRDLPQHERARVLERAADLARDRADELARTICSEAAKPIRTARGEASRCVDTLTFSAVEARTLSGELLPMEASAAGAGKLGYAMRVPIGVVAAITPFNFPLNLVAHKLGPAIAAGCPVVLKPAPDTPLSAIALRDLLVDAGLPDDWITIVTDRGSEAGAPLVEHPIPRMVTFTGSAPVGWKIAELAARKRVALELGSTSPVIVEPGTDVEAIATAIARTGFSHAGQSCISVQRVLVHRDIAGALTDALVAAAEALVVGDPADEATDVGPLIRARENDRVADWIAEATDGGARVVTGGALRDRIFPPTVVADVPTDCRLYKDEVFGPVVDVNRYHDLDQAIAMANATDHAIHAGIFTPDLATALRAARELDFAGVLVNEVPTYRADQQPYGGVRDAGNTREGPAYAVREMTELKTVTLQG
jgi:acyl-CoA reductase-like NAD-dependent aldehyde dehydrogenase